VPWRNAPGHDEEESKRMGEKGKRLGRTGYSRGWLAYLGGGGSIAIALIMILSPVANAASAGVVIHSYHGVVSPNNSLSQSGCGKALEPKKWHFALKTGIGGSASKGLAASCAKQVAGVGQTSSASTYGGFTAGLVLPRIANTATTVNASIEAKWTTSLSASDGGKSATCNNAPSSYSYNDTEWEWNSFSNYAYIDQYTSGGYSYNYSYNTASIPSPFNLNNTTYYYHSQGFTTFAYCIASAFAYADIYAYLVDTTTHVTTYSSSNTVGSNGFLFETGVEVYNETDWGCSQFYEWDEGTSYGSNTTTCFSYNTTLTSVVYSYSPTYSYTTGSNNSQTWTNSSSVAGSIVFSTTFSHHDAYALVLEVYGDAYASNSWQHGSASWNFNMATLGNGMKLTSITIS